MSEKQRDITLYVYDLYQRKVTFKRANKQCCCFHFVIYCSDFHSFFFSLVLQGKVLSVEGETVTMLPKHEDLKVRGVEALST